MISLDYLKTLAVFVKTGSMAAAARELGISQPAVSMQLRALENACPEPVFLNDGTRKVLSPFGQKLYSATNFSLTELQNKTDQCLLNTELERISIAGREGALSFVLDRIKNFPSPVDILICDSQEATRKVLNQEVTFSLSYHIPLSGDIVSKKIFESNPSLAFVEKLNFKLTREEILKTPFIVYRKDDPALLKLCSDYSVPIASLNFALVVQSWPLIRDAAVKGHGVAVIPLELVKMESTLKKISLSSPKFEYHLIYPKHLSKNVLVKEWVKLIIT